MVFCFFYGSCLFVIDLFLVNYIFMWFCFCLGLLWCLRFVIVWFFFYLISLCFFLFYGWLFCIDIKIWNFCVCGFLFLFWFWLVLVIEYVRVFSGIVYVDVESLWWFWCWYCIYCFFFLFCCLFLDRVVMLGWEVDLYFCG